jgi:beta-glucanase (GH16 family)
MTTMRSPHRLACALALVAGTACYGVLAAGPATATAYKFDAGFNGRAGSLPSPAQFTPYTGPSYNNELETYTASPANCGEDGKGHLVITARRIVHPDGRVTYTSCRLETRGLFTMAYGHWQIRARFCSSAGFWPALWYEGSQRRWPVGGEIDQMEDFGKAWQSSALHAALSPSGTRATWNAHSPRFADDCSWHVYQLGHWRTGMWFRVDGRLRWKVPASAYNAASRTVAAAFAEPDFLILNLAVGGNGTGNVTPPASTFPRVLEVDYVRAW